MSQFDHLAHLTDTSRVASFVNGSKTGKDQDIDPLCFQERDQFQDQEECHVCLQSSRFVDSWQAVLPLTGEPSQ